jgi:hypothetical protein
LGAPTVTLSLPRLGISLSFRLCTLGFLTLTSRRSRTICFRLDVRERDRPPVQLPLQPLPVVLTRSHAQNPGP